ncbi:bacteriocin immunity protein [Pantoea sp. EA-12]|uniref:bacteriocin immunity protein n=1 Tax=Pantoea sp. EA-12 TaxID=3043303 RepID=UPI0024B5FF17|nr:bacteriocin immunity protein [Pantoea sp. EA-12]MDI9222132.1 bacteriocin immunity protein [Pantoea sp. EA-12]
MKLKHRFEEYSEAEFTQLVRLIFSAEGGVSFQDELLENFIAVTEHPDGSDLIYYSHDDNLTPEKVVATVRDWRRMESLPDFKK